MRLIGNKTIKFLILGISFFNNVFKTTIFCLKSQAWNFAKQV